MKSWQKAKPTIQSPVVTQKIKLRRITPSLDYQVRQRNLSNKELKQLKGLLFAQKIYPQLTNKQWKLFKNLGKNKVDYNKEGNTFIF